MGKRCSDSTLLPVLLVDLCYIICILSVVRIRITRQLEVELEEATTSPVGSESEAESQPKPPPRRKAKRSRKDQPGSLTEQLEDTVCNKTSTRPVAFYTCYQSIALKHYSNKHLSRMSNLSTPSSFFGPPSMVVNLHDFVFQDSVFEPVPSSVGSTSAHIWTWVLFRYIYSINTGTLSE